MGLIRNLFHFCVVGDKNSLRAAVESDCHPPLTSRGYYKCFPARGNLLPHKYIAKYVDIK